MHQIICFMNFNIIHRLVNLKKKKKKLINNTFPCKIYQSHTNNQVYHKLHLDFLSSKFLLNLALKMVNLRALI